MTKVKLIFQPLSRNAEEGFAFMEMRGEACNCPGHFHPEYELIFVQDTQGDYRMAGDSITEIAVACGFSNLSKFNRQSLLIGNE